MQVCQVISSINQDTGGTAVSVPSLASSLVKEEISSHLFTLDYPECGNQNIPDNVQLHSYPANWFSRYLPGFHLTSAKKLERLAASQLDLIHDHGCWMFTNLYACQAALANQLPFVVSPHGTLEPWSMKRSWFKKRLAWFLYQRKNLSSAALFHATSKPESIAIKQLGFNQPIALIPNGVYQPALNEVPDRDVLIQIFPQLSSSRWVLFLSRIHPKKGIDNLLRVWQQLSSQFDCWHLIIAGSDLIGYQPEMEKLTHELGLKERVTFTGMLTGEAKMAALGNADLFVLPTHSENFGMAIAESLAHGVPVITTKEAPWQELETHQCGWWIDNSQSALTQALAEGMQLSEQERQKMGIRGRSLVAERYSWDFVAKEMASAYRWLLGGGEQPNCILSGKEAL